jgi:hypothetical protein
MGMAPNEVDRISRSLGQLEGALKSFQENWQEQDRRAAEGRRLLYGKFEEIQTDVIDLTHKVANVMSDVAAMKPAVENWVASKNWALGAKAAALGIGTAAGAVVAAAAWMVEHLLLKSPGH